MERHRNISLRTPTNTSLSRATSFNKTNVMAFYSNLENVQQKYKFSATDIYNANETACMTVQKVNNEKVIGPKVQNQLGKVTSGERGTLVTMLAATNAVGNSIPPFLCFSELT